MGFFSGIKETLENLRITAKDYFETQIALVKLQAAEKISSAASAIIAYLVLSVFLLFFLLFGSFALAYFLSEWIGRPFAGFLIVGGLYLLTGMSIFFGRERILRRPILNALIRQWFLEKPGKNETPGDDGKK